MGLRITPLTLRQANELVLTLHRHHKPCVGHRFSLGAVEDRTGVLVGAAIVGRPVARMCDPYLTAEVTRLVTNGHKNACSFLYSAAARVAREMGFKKIQTYILEEEPGTSLVAAGWAEEEEARKTSGGQWKHTSGPRRTDQPTQPKKRFARVLQ